MINRRGKSSAHLALLMTLICALAIPPNNWTLAAEPQDQVERAIALGLSFLARQQADDGSFADGAPRQSITAITLLAYLSAGQAQDVGRHGLTVRRAVDFLTKNAPIDGEDLHSEALAATSLAEAYGVEPDVQRRSRILSVIAKLAATLSAAPEETDMGRWRWRVVALRSAQSVGIEVAADFFDRAVARAVASLQPNGAPSAESTSAAMIVLSLLKSSDRADVAAGARFLAASAVGQDQSRSYERRYDIAQAAALAGERSSVWDPISMVLIGHQSPDGSWPASREGEPSGRAYSTGMAVLTLAIPQRVLTAVQR